MRLERLNYNKIKIFLTQDDLSDRGLTKEDLWKDSLKVHQLFREMMDEASEELGFEANGPIAVEVYSLQAQGMVIIVTKHQEDEEDEYSDFLEMDVKLDESEDILFEFHDLDDCINVAKVLYRLGIRTGTLYSYGSAYYLLFDQWQKIPIEQLVAILAEFGHSTPLTVYRIEEYGKKLMEENAIEQLNIYF
ncbi:genetic competence negative regulator [Bacillus kexueae]|uniref:genetic competence negative regulator n=1 Tax=Aeribacillus kexueae TaxID=2078952 RepID=UPI001FAEEC90|nr:genetic competence negative regulator [Bacillus kexueae]